MYRFNYHVAATDIHLSIYSVDILLPAVGRSCRPRRPPPWSPWPCTWRAGGSWCSASKTSIRRFVITEKAWLKAATTAFNQEKALVGAFSVITNLRMELFEALLHWYDVVRVERNSDPSSDWWLLTIVAGHDAKLAWVKLLIHGHGYLILSRFGEQWVGGPSLHLEEVEFRLKIYYKDYLHRD